MDYIGDKISTKKILLVGDLILDRFYYGTVERISPEAPVPVFLENEKMVSLGGAGNVAANLVAAKQQVTVLSVIGDDKAGDEIEELLKKINVNCNYLIRDKDRVTSEKNRFLGKNGQQLLRHDYEKIQDISERSKNSLLDNVKKIVDEHNLVVVSDYGKGVCSSAFLRQLIIICKEKNIPVICDVKGTDAKKYLGATLIKPNLKELGDLIGRKVETKDQIVKTAMLLQKKCETDYVLLTMGEKGMMLVDRHENVTHIKCAPCEVYDVTGAGDTVLAFVSMGMANNLNMSLTLQLSNCAAGLQVQKSGTVAIPLDSVLQSYSGHGDLSNKIIENVDIEKIRDLYKDKKIVFTNGCFDILHAGHVCNLKRAAELGDILIVAVNSDASVKRLKGEKRPINNLYDRMNVLAALEVVSFVTWFDEDTPYNMINRLRPDILVKGEDYQNKEVVGSKVLSEYGGKVVLLPFLAGRSTSDVIRKLEG